METLIREHTFADGRMHIKRRRRDLPSAARRDMHGINILSEMQLKEMAIMKDLLMVIIYYLHSPFSHFQNSFSIYFIL